MSRGIRHLMIAMVIACVGAADVARARTASMEFTPGPRMIRFIERIAHEYEGHDSTLHLSETQQEAIADLLRAFKKDMWLKEAILIGIFQELEDKRRYGLLAPQADYRTANTLTGGIETDELSLFIETLTKLQGILTDGQRQRLRDLWHPPLTVQMSQGATIKIALLSLEGIAQPYTWQDDLRLTDEQAEALRTLLAEGRADLIRMGTVVDLNRVEGDELALTPDVRPEQLREKMTKTGDMEAELFAKLFDLSDRVERLLAADQRARLHQLKQRRAEQASTHGYGHTGNRPPSDPAEPRRFDFFLDQIDALHLSGDQVAQLVSLKEETRKTILLEEARLRGMELDLTDQLYDRNRAAGGDSFNSQLRQLEDIRLKIMTTRLEGYMKSREVLTAEQRARSFPVQSLFEGHSKP